MSTVSRVLAGSTVDPGMARRVREAVAALGYQPNRVASSLRRQSGTVWALLVSDIENPFFTALARGVEDTASEAGFPVVLCNTDENVDKERRYIDLVLAERVAGVILTPASESSDLSALAADGVPIVTVDRRVRADVVGTVPVDAVLVDNVAGARSATSHLYDAGYRGVACITGPAGVTTADERCAGYRAAIEASGLNVDDRLIRRTDFKVGGGYAAAAELLSGTGRRPDALFVANNLMAAGALAAVRDAGLHVPGELGVAAFDDTPWGALMAPALTTVVQPAYEMGRRAAQLLARRLGERGDATDRGNGEVVTLRTELRVRATSAGPS